LDALLLDRAVALGARVVPDLTEPAVVVAHGRKFAAPKGRRLFGFKAHFRGPMDDAIELFFFKNGYVGVNPIEDSQTNVCGIVAEEFLRDLDAVVYGFPPLAARLRPLSRVMRWLTTGPLTLRNGWSPASAAQYIAGDALSFVDPFTGSGLLNALVTGGLAGAAASCDSPVPVYLDECRRRLERPFWVSSLLRAAVTSGWAERLMPLAPGKWLVKMTRARPA
jgi:flavin-dependent dehydrogenase